jgi:ribosomal protein L29
MTINELLVLQKAVRERKNELSSLRSQLSTKERFFSMNTENKVVEPQYDVKAVDKKIVELELFLFKADAAVKQANATTQINIEANVDVLLAPLQ